MNIVIPPGIAALEPKIKTFVDAMVFKLAKNSHKGAWEDVEFATARRRLMQEVEELDSAVQHGGNVIELILEAADVANFALIIANISIRDAGKNEGNTAGATRTVPGESQ